MEWLALLMISVSNNSPFAGVTFQGSSSVSIERSECEGWIQKVVFGSRRIAFVLRLPSDPL